MSNVLVQIIRALCMNTGVCILVVVLYAGVLDAKEIADYLESCERIDKHRQELHHKTWHDNHFYPNQVIPKIEIILWAL